MASAIFGNAMSRTEGLLISFIALRSNAA